MRRFHLIHSGLSGNLNTSSINITVQLASRAREANPVACSVVRVVNANAWDPGVNLGGGGMHANSRSVPANPVKKTTVRLAREAGSR